MFTRQQLDAAHELINPWVPPTPQHRWPLLCQTVGCSVWVKHENHTATGAFKIRGGLVYLHELARGRIPPEHLITATRGNHGQSIPFAAALHDIPVTVVVPQGNSVEKNAAMAGWGATVRTVGTDFDEARVAAERLAGSGAGQLVPSFHEHLVRGVATYALELFLAVPDLDVVYVPIGMGSGICGLIRVRDLLGLSTRIVGVVSTSADAVAQSFERGKVVETATAATFADGIATRVPHPDALAIVRAGADRIVRVTDDEIAAAVRVLYTTTHNLAEGAGAAACAAILKERVRSPDLRAAVILTGGNIDRDVFRLILEGRTPMVEPGGQPAREAALDRNTGSGSNGDPSTVVDRT